MILSETLTILAIGLCLFQLRLVSSFIILAKEFSEWYQQYSVTETQDSPEKIALSPYDAMDRLGGRSSNGADGKRLGNGLRNAVKAFRAALQGDEHISQNESRNEPFASVSLDRGILAFLIR